MASVRFGMKLVGIILVVLLSACSSKTKVESDLNISGAPDWVNEGTNILKDKDGRLFHGVGFAPVMGDMSLQKSTADNRARAEVARVLSSYMNVVSKDYVESVGTGEQQELSQAISHDIENITQVNLTGAKIIGNYRDEKSNTIYSIAELDMKHVKGILDNVDNMNAGFRDYIKSQGDNIFDRMAGERK
jgi:hypothetical protein